MLAMRPEDRIRARNIQQRKTTPAEEARRKRTECALRLRQDFREEIASKRRRATTLEVGMEVETTEVVNRRLAELPDHIQAIFSDDPEAIGPALESLRKLLSLETRPPIQQCIEGGVLPRLVALLGAADFPKLQYEACWSLTNIATGPSELVRQLVEAGAVPQLIPLMTHADLEVRGQAIWALANIAGDGPECRDYVLRMGVMAPLLSLLVAPNPTVKVQRDATWLLSNLCRGKDAPWDIISPSIPVLLRLLYSADNDVLTDAAWTLLFITDSGPTHAARIMAEGLGPQLVSLLKHPSYAVQMPVLRVVGNILFGDENQTQALINLKVISGIEHLMKSDNPRLRKEATWGISNITAGNSSQIQTVIENSELMHLIVDLAQYAESSTKQEAIYTLCNAVNGGTFEQIRILVQNFGVLHVLCTYLDYHQEQELATIMTAVDNILIAGSKDPKVAEDAYIQIVEQTSGLDKLEDLHSHDSEAIWKQAAEIIKRHWQTVDENTSPAINANGSYAWGWQQ